MECDDTEPPSRSQPPCRSVYRLLQYVQFPVDLNPYRLKRALCRMRSILPRALRHSLFDDLHQPARRFNGPVLPFLYNKLRNTLRPSLLAICEYHAVEFFLVVAVYHVIRTERLVRIHAHIQRRILLVGKPSLPFIQLMRRYADIQQHPVYFFYSKPVQNTGNIAEIIPHERYPVLIVPQPFPCRFLRVRILVYANEPAAFQPLYNFQRMPAAAHRAVHITAVRVYIQLFDALPQKYRNMMKFHLLYPFR